MVSRRPTQRQEKPQDGGVAEAEQIWTYGSDCVPIKPCLSNANELPDKNNDALAAAGRTDDSHPRFISSSLSFFTISPWL